VVSPPWLDPGATDKLIILIEPNMAFGTGTHETTQLCLEAISELHTPDQSVMDVGTGTGILSIAAAKLGCRQITACDTDADAVAIARENARLNAVDDLIVFFDGSVDENSPSADLVVANLTIDVILPMLPLLIKITRRHLLLSGILAEQKPLITDALSEGPDLKFEIRRKGEWIAVIVSSQAS
jgi:ribosomal protein L11 methyltransferase